MAKSKPLDEVRELHNNKRKENLLNKTKAVRYTFESLALLLEATALATVSGFAIWSGWNCDLPTWGKWVLLIAGSFIAIRAFVEFVKFLNRRA